MHIWISHLFGFFSLVGWCETVVLVEGWGKLEGEKSSRRKGKRATGILNRASTSHSLSHFNDINILCIYFFQIAEIHDITETRLTDDQP